MKLKNNFCPVKVNVRIRQANDGNIPIIALNEEDDTALAIGDKAFIFDKIFNNNATQEEIYSETVKPFVEKMLSGYSCTCLAYGQTGTGKTYTMFGKNKSADYNQNAGLISRALDDVFATLTEDIENRKMKVEISFVEIYNDKIFDLLKPNKDKSECVFKNSKIEPSVLQEVRMVYEAREFLKFGVRHRHMGETKMNANSSRSHAIFTIKCTIDLNSTSRISKLHLVDLGGTEKIKRTGNEGIALAEGIKVNQSLLVLRQVLIALSRNDRVIPIRESVLTTYLSDSLTIKNFIILIVCISPQRNDLSETINTLRFAESTKEIKSKPEIELVYHKLKEINPEIIENGNLLINGGINPTPLKTIRLNHTISTPGHRFKLPKTVCNKVNNTYSPMHSSAIIAPPMDTMLRTEKLFSDFDLDPVNLSSSTVIENQPSNNYSPIVKKCTAAIEDKLSNLVSDHLNTIMRRRSKRLALIQEQIVSPPLATTKNINNDKKISSPRETPFRSSLMTNFENSIKQMVETRAKEMFEKTLNKYLLDKKDLVYARKLFSDENTEICTITNSEQCIDISPAHTLSTLSQDSSSTESLLLEQKSNDHIFKIPASLQPIKTTQHRVVRRSKRISMIRCLVEKENVDEYTDDEMMEANNCTSTVKTHRHTRSKLSTLLNSNQKNSSSCCKRVPKIPQRYSPVIIPTPLKIKKDSKKTKLKASIVKHRENVLQILNKGSSKELCKLSLVGPKTCEHIITYRSLHGPFDSLKDLKNMKFWSEKQLNKFMQNNFLE